MKKEKKNNKKKKRELKKQYCFTLLPSTMDKVEKKADKNFASISATVESILREHS